MGRNAWCRSNLSENLVGGLGEQPLSVGTSQISLLRTTRRRPASPVRVGGRRTGAASLASNGATERSVVFVVANDVRRCLARRMLRPEYASCAGVRHLPVLGAYSGPVVVLVCGDCAPRCLQRQQQVTEHARARCTGSARPTARARHGRGLPAAAWAHTVKKKPSLTTNSAPAGHGLVEEHRLPDSSPAEWPQTLHKVLVGCAGMHHLRSERLGTENLTRVYDLFGSPTHAPAAQWRMTCPYPVRPPRTIFFADDQKVVDRVSRSSVRTRVSVAQRDDSHRSGVGVEQIRNSRASRNSSIGKRVRRLDAEKVTLLDVTVPVERARLRQPGLALDLLESG